MLKTETGDRVFLSDTRLQDCIRTQLQLLTSKHAPPVPFIPVECPQTALLKLCDVMVWLNSPSEWDTTYGDLRHSMEQILRVIPYNKPHVPSFIEKHFDRHRVNMGTWFAPLGSSTQSYTQLYRYSLSSVVQQETSRPYRSNRMALDRMRKIAVLLLCVYAKLIAEQDEDNWNSFIEEITPMYDALRNTTIW